MSPISSRTVRDMLSYDPHTGNFRWRASRSRGARAGDIAGTKDAQGYIIIGIGRRYYKAHRLAFLWVNGAWPENSVDHINGRRDDNRFCNLRDVSHAENCRNQRASKNSKSGVKGVHWHVRRDKWCASIRVSRKLIHLGYFDDLTSATEAYNQASVRYHGEFGRLNAMLHDEKQKAPVALTTPWGKVPA